jgi:hypothetical protein
LFVGLGDLFKTLLFIRSLKMVVKLMRVLYY